ncbi:MAG TPA: DedA family protein [Methanomassiliicoccaceae archaeon]|nr:DedA family protein [Methanomassiliicoccaceae archaeon]
MSILETLNDLVIGLIDQSGYLGIFLAMFIEGIFTPIPSEIIVPLAGYLASVGRFNIVLVVLISSAGATSGSSVAYLIGRRLGRPFVDRYGRYFGFGHDSLCKADAWFDRWGNYGILLGHSLPGIRSVISFPAGIAKMGFTRFVIFTFVGALIWNSVLMVAGYLLGASYLRISESLEGWDLVILAAIGVAFIAWVAYGRWKNNNSECRDQPR